MTIQAAEPGSEQVTQVKLESVLSIDIASSFREELDEASELRQDIIINAEDVELADTTALQLLMALVVKIRQQGMGLTWESPSAVLRSSATLAGLEQQLGLIENTI